ncbi:MAG: glycoside hydrolase family 15 protein [Methanohalobium sp.]|uniref:glycoside hydrolase family 15 protein n=1 Tax=Methanohalobium sp. TaxID=2837493 RepID=UPI00397811B8
MGEDEKGVIRDLYYPYVGQENHGKSIRIGVCDLDNLNCSWLENWELKQIYKSNFSRNFIIPGTSKKTEVTDKQNLSNGYISNIGETIFENSDIGLEVHIYDAIHPSINYFYRIFEIKNTSDKPRNLRFFSTHNYRILEDKLAETAVVDRDFLVHYKRNRYFLHSSYPVFDQWAVGDAEWNGFEGTWKDMEDDGQLSGNVVAHGSVDSTIGWTISDLQPGQSKEIHFWIATGENYTSTVRIHNRIKNPDYNSLFRKAFNFWNSFIERFTIFPEYRTLDQLPDKIRRMFYRSLLATISHMDINGSVIASCDTDIKQFGADYYTYCWPRDASWAVVALDSAKYHNLSLEVFDFYSKIISGKGYFLHKYTPAGDFGSTWHPVPMIQIDETGLPLYALYNNWLMSRNVWTIGRYFMSIVVPAANYLARSIDSDGLPISSFDLWEERKGVHTYSACTVYAGLHGAAEIAKALGHDMEFEYWSKSAQKVKNAIIEYLYDKEEKRFKRSLNDSTVDSSIFGVWYFGILPPDDERVVNTMKAIENKLSRPSGGIARYVDDNYMGHMNSWIICTLWVAQWHIAIGNLDRAMDLINWCADNSHPTTGLMSEQVANDGSLKSVLPLMWSHSSFVLAVYEYLKAITENYCKLQ